MIDSGNGDLVAYIIAANVSIALGAFALIKRVVNKPDTRPKEPLATINPECVTRMLTFMDSTEKVLIAASKIQHTQVRYMDDLRQELSSLRVEISELKGRMR